MPARVFRYVVHNKTEGMTLRFAASDTCWGEWTPGGWAPAAEIPPGGSGGFQAESDGVLTGCEVWVSYRVADQLDATRGHVLLYANNPYFGTTDWHHATYAQPPPNPCDHDDIEETQAPYDPASGIRLDVVSLRRNGVPTNIDEATDYIRLPFAPFWIFGARGIWERVEIELEFDWPENLLPRFGHPPARTERRLVRNPQADQLGGRWLGAHVVVTIAHRADRVFGVKVEDGTPGVAPLNFEADCTFGSHSVPQLVRHEFEPALEAAGRARAELQTPRGRAAWNAALNALNEVAPANDGQLRRAPGPRWQRNIHRRADAERTLRAAAGNSPLVTDLAGAVAALTPRTDYALHPGNGVALELWAKVEDGRTNGFLLHYQRLTPAGRSLVDQFLTFDLGIR